MRYDDSMQATTAQTPGWLIAEPLDPAIALQVADFNRRGLQQQLALLAAQPTPPRRDAGLPRAVVELTALWRSLDEAALERLAAMPYLLFEVGLGSARLFSRPASAATAARPPRDIDFARMVLHYAWHLARANPLGAAVGLGMPTPCAAELRELSFGELESFVPAAAARLCLRWGGRPAVWAALLTAAAGSDSALLEREQLSGLRRIAGDLLSAAASPEARGAEPLW